MGKSKSKRESKSASGMTRKRRCLAAINRLEMKVKRWKRYIEEEKKPAEKSKRAGWDTTGLEKHIELLKSIASKGKSETKRRR